MNWIEKSGYVSPHIRSLFLINKNTNTKILYTHYNLKKGIPIATITIISGTYNGPISSPVFPRYYPKKFNLLRYLENIGFDIDHYYHPDIWWN